MLKMDLLHYQRVGKELSMNLWSKIKGLAGLVLCEGSRGEPCPCCGLLEAHDLLPVSSVLLVTESILYFRFLLPIFLLSDFLAFKDSRLDCAHVANPGKSPQLKVLLITHRVIFALCITCYQVWEFGITRL